MNTMTLAALSVALILLAAYAALSVANTITRDVEAILSVLP